MKNSTGILLIIASVFVIVGAVIFVGVMMVLNWDFSRLSTVKFRTKSHVVNSEFVNISVSADTADIVLLPSEDGVCRVVCHEEEKQKHTVSVDGETLTVRQTNTKKWYEYIGISWGTAKITVYLPETEYGSLTIKGSTGDVEIPKEFTFESVDILSSTGDVSCVASVSQSAKITLTTGGISLADMSALSIDLSVSSGSVTADSVNCVGEFSIGVSTGRTELLSVKCGSLVSSGSTGNILLKNTVADGSISVKRSTGNVCFEDSDASEIYVNTSTGNVKGSLLSDKVYITETDTGKVKVPRSVVGGRCEISTSTGDIILTVN